MPRMYAVFSQITAAQNTGKETTSLYMRKHAHTQAYAPALTHKTHTYSHVHVHAH